MTETDKGSEAALTAALDLGELLLKHGAEVHRVEDTISRLGKRLGFVRVDVFSITSAIVVTAFTEDGRAVTQTRRIQERDTNLGLVTAVNAASRKFCGQDGAAELSLPSLLRMTEDIRKSVRAHPVRDLLMFILISFSLTVFFGGTALDGAASVLSGTVLYYALCFCADAGMNSLLMNGTCSFLTGAAAILLVRAGIGAHPDKIMIGNIMLVIPGIQLVVSLRDMINGDTISGMLNLTEAVLKALAVASGFSLAMKLLL